MRFTIATEAEMDTDRTRTFVETLRDDSIVPEIAEYIRIPNKSPHFDPDWAEHGYMEDAVRHMMRWVEAHPVAGMRLEVVRLEGRTPLILVDVSGDGEDCVLLYGHLDKQPEMTGRRTTVGSVQRGGTGRIVWSRSAPGLRVRSPATHA